MNKNHIRVCITRRSPTLPEPYAVNVAGTWDEGYRSYPGRSGRYVMEMKFDMATYTVMYG